jgi:hypothetical protein
MTSMQEGGFAPSCAHNFSQSYFENFFAASVSPVPISFVYILSRPYFLNEEENFSQTLARKAP